MTSKSVELILSKVHRALILTPSSASWRVGERIRSGLIVRPLSVKRTGESGPDSENEATSSPRVVLPLHPDGLGDLNFEIAGFDPPARRRDDSSTPNSTQRNATHFSKADLLDFNDEIGGYVGVLGDPDFDLQDPSRRPAGRQKGSPSGGSSDALLAGVTAGSEPINVVDDSSEDERVYYNTQHLERREGTKGGDIDGDRAHLHSHTQRRRRWLTLADDPSLCSAHNHMAPGQEMTGTSQPTQPVVDDGYDMSRKWSASGLYQSSGGQAAEPLLEGTTTMDGNKVTSSRTSPTRKGVGARTTRTPKRAVLVLNGAACFIRDRLASTGEPGESIAASLENSAAELGLSLTVCTSNRAADLLDRICVDKYDAIVYNPAAFGGGPPHRHTMIESRPTGGAPHNFGNPATLNEPTETGRDCGDGGTSALKYALQRARCPVVMMLPRDSRQGAGKTWSFSSSGKDVAFDLRDGIGESGGLISGFSGAASYKLALAAVATLLEEEEEDEKEEQGSR